MPIRTDAVLISKYLLTIAPNSIYKVQCRDTSTYYCYTAQNTHYKLCLFPTYHYNIKASLFVDVTAADLISNRHRFFISYNLYSIYYNVRVMLSHIIHDRTKVFSVTKLFPAANWYEREIWDMFGISFIGHTDLRRLLTDYGFRGHPLKKDYPLSGFIEVHYDEQYKCIMYNDVNLVQDYRYWSFESPRSFYAVNNSPS